MSIEQQLADFVCDLKIGDVAASAQRIVRLMVQAVVGTGMAGAAEDGIAALRELLLERGGTAQASTLVFGDRLPASAAAQFNATLCRALDYCDAMAPGPHIGSSLFPAALAAAELAGGCSGSEFMAALIAGAELSSRLNLNEAQYNGLDPTGVAVVFAATAAAARILRLTPTQTLHALALGFNRCGGSFQSHVDGSLGVRIVQGWVAEAGVSCAQMAQRGITGPVNFLTGHYGYAQLYGRGKRLFADAVASIAGHLGASGQRLKVRVCSRQKAKGAECADVMSPGGARLDDKERFQLEVESEIAGRIVVVSTTSFGFANVLMHSGQPGAPTIDARKTVPVRPSGQLGGEAWEADLISDRGKLLVFVVADEKADLRPLEAAQRQVGGADALAVLRELERLVGDSIRRDPGNSTKWAYREIDLAIGY